MRRETNGKVECPHCEGDREVPDMSRRGTNCRSLEPPMMDCPFCCGSGVVDEDLADEYDEHECYYIDAIDIFADERYERMIDRMIDK